MKPDIVFLTIDSLRADKCTGPNKSSKTPNLDKIIKNGVYFEQAISSADQTGTSLASIFTGNSPSKTGLTQINFSKDTETYFDTLRKEGYHLECFVPDGQFFIDLTAKVEKAVHYPFEKKETWKRLNEGLGKKLINFLDDKESQHPFIKYIHVMDIRPPFDVPDEYNSEEFGDTRYDQLLSSIDYWIGKITDVIDFENTLLVISSDHGEYIPVTGERISEIPKLQNAIRKGTKSVPFLEKIGMKTILNLRFAAQTYRKEFLKRTLTPFEMRSFNTRAGIELYDELIRVPLIFIGKNINSEKTVKNLVRHIDIFPTILDIIQIPQKKSTDGRSLKPIIEEKETEELPAYIEVGINLAQLMDKKDDSSLPKVIGLRTSKFKYIRARNSQTQHVKLFDLINDPKEENNLAEIKKDIVKKMEDQLQKTIENRASESKKLTDDEIQKAKDVLANLGYL